MSSQNTLYNLVERLEALHPNYVSLLAAQSDDKFCKAFDMLIENAVKHLEANAGNFQGLAEEGLSAVVAAYCSVPGVRVTQEQHSGGHVDLTFEIGISERCKLVLGEAKIYDGPQYHIKGLQQLMGRYLTGREKMGVVLAYVRKKDVLQLIQRVREEFDASKPEQQVGNTASHQDIKWAFLSVHRHSSGEDINISHIGCNLFLNEN